MKVNIPVSQIFLTLTDKTINDFPVFLKSRQLFRKLTKKYTLFDDKKAEKLMKKYPEFYSMWKEVPYAIMKVDILRFIILYHYGGFISDLDQFPNVNNLKNLVDENKFTIFTPKRRFNYEIIYSPQHNEICLNFLRYVKTQIEEKSKMKIYKTWKGRFVLQTTGPKSFERFIKLYYKNDPSIEFVEVGTILTTKDAKEVFKNMNKFPFISLQTSEWLSSIGSKELQTHKKEFVEKLMDLF
jgi:mannosyltransferase OCH1-like enzyme